MGFALGPKSLEMISQFRCTSSLVLLTHPEFINKAKTKFEIDTIYNKTQSEVWKFTDEQNISAIEIDTFQIKLKFSRGFGDIVKFCLNYNRGSSIFDITAVPKNLEIAEDLPEPPEEFDIKNLVEGIQYTVPDDLAELVPKTKNMRKHVKYNGINLSLYTRADQTPVCEMDRT